MARTIRTDSARPRLAGSKRANLSFVCLALTAVCSAQTYNWNQFATSGNWSDATKWIGSIPAAGGSATTILNFINQTSSGVTATNNIAGPFTLNGLNMLNYSTAGGPWAMNVTLSAGNGLNFVGPNAFINFGGSAGFGTSFNNIIAGAGGISLADNLTLQNNVGTGGLAITTVISGTGGLTLNAGATSNPNTGILNLTGANTFAGGVTQNGGHLQIGSATALGTGTYTYNGGFLSSSAAVTVANAVQLNTTLNFMNMSANALTLSGPINAATGVGINVLGSGVLGLASASNHDGVTNIGGFSPASALAFGQGGSITLSGNGTMLNTPTVNMTNGAGLVLSNTATALSDRLGNATAVNMNSAQLILSGNANTGVAESIGALTLSGGINIISVIANTASAPTVSLQASSFTRNDRATAFFRGFGLGSQAIFNATGWTPMLIGGGGAAGSTNQSILPWGMSDFTTTANSQGFFGNTFVTWDAVNGIRPLNINTEYATAFGGDATNNVRLATATSVGTTETVNSLIINAALSGTGTVNVTSGAIMTTGGAAFNVQPNFNFGSAEGFIYLGSSLTATTIGTPTFQGNLTGSNGLTIGGFGGQVIFTGDNTGLTGTLTVNGPNVRFNSLNALPGTGQIVANGISSTSLPGFGYTGAGDVTLNRTFSVRGGVVGFTNASAGTVMTINGGISGNGGLATTGQAAAFGFVRLSGTNSYNGPTRLGGNTRITSDAVFGNSTSVDLSTGTTAGFGLILEGDWTTNRTVTVASGSLIDTNGFNATWNGLYLNNTSGLTKAGAGTLTINSANGVAGSGTASHTINGGTLLMNANYGRTGLFTVGATTGTTRGAFGGNATVGNMTLNALGDITPGSGGIGTIDGNLLTWNGGGRMLFDLGAPGTSDLITLANNFTRGSAGTFQFDFSDGGGIAPGLYTLVTFAGTTNFLLGDFSYTSTQFGSEFVGNFILNPNSLQFQVQAVPEPGTIAALGLGALALLRRRKKA